MTALKTHRCVLRNSVNRRVCSRPERHWEVPQDTTLPLVEDARPVKMSMGATDRWRRLAINGATSVRRWADARSRFWRTRMHIRMHTSTHTRTRARIHTHTHSGAQSHTCARAHLHTHSCIKRLIKRFWVPSSEFWVIARKHLHAHARNNARAHATRAQTIRHTHSHAKSHTYSRAHICTQARTRACMHGRARAMRMTKLIDDFFKY